MKTAHLLLPAMFVVGPLAAQDEPGTPSAVLNRAAGVIRVDGRLDDAAWGGAPVISGFTQVQPDEGAPGSERTEVRIVYDEEALYVGARLHDRQRPTARLGRRDGSIPSDWFGIVFDSRHDHRSGFGFWVNAGGVRSDGRLNDAVFEGGWDAVWEAKVQVDSAGWTAELRIPLSQLRFRPGSDEWGLQMNRFIKRREEDALWSFVPRSRQQTPARYGHLRGTESLRTGSRLEAAPYSVARSERVERGANAFRGDAEYAASFGLDLKYRLSGTLTLDATLNPDFGTVEQDPSQVNLSAFEVELPERRPFFMEGADVFDFGRGATGYGSMNRRLIYPRRIGRAPQLSGPAGSDRPSASTILGAAKVTGTLPGGWTMGLFSALTQEERVRWMDSAGVPRHGTAEPFTAYTAARLLREWRDGATRVGILGTAVQRRLDADAAEKLRSSATVLGTDWSHEWAGRSWRLSGYAAASHVTGTTGAMLRTQRASNRYQQRPDAPHLAVDSAATAMAGFTGQLQLTRQSGRHWLGDAWVSATTSGYEVNDLGYAVRSDIRSAGGRLIYRETQPGRLLRSWSVTGHARADYNGAGDRLWAFLWGGAEAITTGYWRGILNGAVVAPRLDDRATRGGPLLRIPGDLRLYSELWTDGRRPLTGGIGTFLRRGGEGGSEWYAFGQAGYRPNPQWSISLRPELTLLHNPVHFVTRAADAEAVETFGERYLFGDLRQTTVALEGRVEYTFSPEMSLQLFARPFVSAGEIAEYRELLAPRSLQWGRYGAGHGTATPTGQGGWLLDPDGPGPRRATQVGDNLGEADFVVRTLRGSAVFRWEWRPGSTLFVAWQQARDDEQRGAGGFSARRDGAAILATPPDNVFVVKMSYWLGR